MIKKAFSLAEMMVVMLILSIVLAAAMPIITHRVAASNNESNEVYVPVGMIMWYPGTIPPKGFLECNGQSTSSYPQLAAIVGTNVPDLRGQFIRGWDHSKNIDTNREILSVQIPTTIRILIDNYFEHSAPSLTGTFAIGASNIDRISYVTSSPSQTSTVNLFNNYYLVNPNYVSIVSGLGDNVGFTTRPTNVALLPCIKY